MSLKLNKKLFLFFAFIAMLKYADGKSVNASSKHFSEENDEFSGENDANTKHSIKQLLHHILDSQNEGGKLNIFDDSSKLTEEEKFKKLKSVLHRLVIFFDEMKNQKNDDEEEDYNTSSEYHLNNEEHPQYKPMRNLFRMKKSKLMNKKSWNIPMRAFKWNNKGQSKSNTPQQVYDQLLRELNN